jgi:hypothetical protein
VVDDTHATAVWSAEEAVDQLADVARSPLPAPRVARDAYFALMALGDASCPGDPYQLMSTRVPNDGCGASSGARFIGVSRWLAGSAVEGSNMAESFLLFGDMRIVEPDHDALEVGGFAVLQLANGERRFVRHGEVSGSWVQDNGRDWLGDGLSATLTLDHVVQDGMAGARVTGGLAQPRATVHFDSLTFGGDCGDNASGAISVRDPSGGWWRYDLGNTRCDGCGTLAFEDEPATDVCVDVSPLAAAVDAALDPS